MKIDVSFLGVPKIAICGRDTHIHQKKLFALLLYLLYMGRCTREELAYTFWGNLRDDSSRQNLRNGLHRLKKFLGEGILDTRGNTTIAISPQVEIQRDTDLLVADDAGSKLLEFKSFAFLEDLYLRDTPEFDAWTSSMRTAYEKIAIDRLESNMRENLRSDRSAAEQYAVKLLAVCPYQEEAARVLISQYSNRGMYSEAIQAYKRFSQHLLDDLGLEPEEETRRIHQAALEMRDIQNRYPRNWIASSLHEGTRDKILKEHDAFLHARKYRHCIVLGTLGAGKSQVIDAFVRMLGSANYLRVRFEVSGVNIPFHAADEISRLLARSCGLPFEEPNCMDMETLRLYQITSMNRLVRRIAANKPRVLVLIENMEMMDRQSMELILTYLMDKDATNVMVVGEYCSSFRSDRRAIEEFELMENVCLCQLPPLGRQDALSYLSTRLSDSVRPGLDFYDIWRKTGGVLMLLEDACTQIRAGAGDWYAPSDSTLKKLTALLSSLDEDERNCLELLSAFHHGVEAEVLAAVSGKSAIELSVTLDKLYRRELIWEEDYESHLLTRIAVEVIREAIYRRISRLRRREIHRTAARFYQERDDSPQRDYHYLRELKYHFEMAGQEYEQVRYSLKELWYRLDYCDDFFPTIQNDPQILDTFYLSKTDAYREFERLEALLGHLSNYRPPEQMWELYMIFDYLRGRALIRDSLSSRGVALIRGVIQLAEALGRDDMLLKSYLEIVFSGIKTQNEPLMRDYIAKAREIPTFAEYYNEKGILLRLEALCDIMTGRHDRAESLLLQSIEVLQNPRLQSYSYINVAAAYDYLAAIYRARRDYERAEEYLKKAVSLCERNNVKKSLDLLYTDLGYTMFLQKNYTDAKENFMRSAEIYSRFDNYWLRSVGESCMAMICCEENDPETALEHYRRAEIYSRKDRIEEEISLLNQAREELERSGIL